MNNIIYRLWLADSVNASVANRLITIYKSAENIYNRTDYKEADFLRPASLKKLTDKNITHAVTAKENADIQGIKILTPEMSEFPPLLKTIPDCPTVLFAKGIIPDWNNLFPVAVVGTRNLTPDGAQFTKNISASLATSGACVVSGFARGADSIAHESALNNGGFTIAVLGCGVDVIYPRSNLNLYMKTLKNGLFLSEYLPGAKAATYNFPERNRIIAGISKCMVVTEAPKGSGAIISANFSIKYKRPVFANPFGAELLLKNGAKPVYSIEDITCKPLAPTHKPTHEKDPILCALESGNMGIDDLAIKLGISITECNSKCFMLELEGKISKLPGNIYRKI